MKRLIITLLCLYSLAISSFGQSSNVWDTRRDFQTGFGIMAPMKTNSSVGAENLYYFTYGSFRPNGLGYRTGLSFAPLFDGIDCYIGVPALISWRTGKLQNSTLMYLDPFDYYDPFYYDSESILGDLLFDILTSCISRTELYAGFTPGILMGNSNIHSVRSYYQNQYEEGTMNNSHLALSLDLGANFEWRIWRFTFGFAPAVHYFLTDNIHEIKTFRNNPGINNDSSSYTSISSPLRWHVSACISLGFMF